MSMEFGGYTGEGAKTVVPSKARENFDEISTRTRLEKNDDFYGSY